MRPAAVAQVGVHRVGKVDGRSALGQLDHGGVRRQHINAVVKQAAALVIGLCSPGQVPLPSQQLAQHGDFGVVFAGGRHPGVAFGPGLLVGPVRGHAVLCVFMHGPGADLHLDGAPIGIAHHGVQRLVAVGFGLGDVVVKLLGNRHKVLVHPAEYLVAVGHGGHHHAQCPDVEHTLKGQGLAAHFAHDAVDVFGPPLDRGLNALASQGLLEAFAQRHHVALALGALFIQQAGNVLVSGRLQKTERQVFHFPFDLPNAQTVGQRCKHLQRLAGQSGWHRQLGGGVMS